MYTVMHQVLWITATQSSQTNQHLTNGWFLSKWQANVSHMLRIIALIATAAFLLL